jgi:hypothetical protein
VPVPYFLLFLCFKKATQEIFSELDETKAEPPIFTEVSRRPKMRWRGATCQAHPTVARPTPGPCHQGVRPAGPLIRPFCITILYYNLLLFIDIFHI